MPRPSAGPRGRVGPASRSAADPPIRLGPAPRAGAGDRGAVTVEAALALASLVVVVALALGAIGAGAAAVRCQDAARELARLAARGEPDRGRAVAAQLAPAGAEVQLVEDGDTVTARVTAPAVGPLPLRVSGRAVAAVEPGGWPP